MFYPFSYGIVRYPIFPANGTIANPLNLITKNGKRRSLNLVTTTRSALFLSTASTN
jgi:hypothetical protein